MYYCQVARTTCREQRLLCLTVDIPKYSNEPRGLPQEQEHNRAAVIPMTRPTNLAQVCYAINRRQSLQTAFLEMSVKHQMTTTAYEHVGLSLKE